MEQKRSYVQQTITCHSFLNQPNSYYYKKEVKDNVLFSCCLYVRPIEVLIEHTTFSTSLTPIITVTAQSTDADTRSVAFTGSLATQAPYGQLICLRLP